jgi:hypothetical protein
MINRRDDAAETVFLTRDATSVSQQRYARPRNRRSASRLQS